MQHDLSLWDYSTCATEQLMTHRVNYLETYRKWCFLESPPLLRQVFIKDICEVSVDNYRKLGDSYLVMFLKFCFLYVCPVVGFALIVYSQLFGYSDSEDRLGNSDRSQSMLLTIVGGVLLALWLVAVIIVLCRKPVPEIIIGTRCPQMPALAITLSSKKDRLKLLEELSDLLAKHQ